MVYGGWKGRRCHTYHLDFDWGVGVCAGVHGQPVVEGLVVSTVVGEDEGDVDGLVVGFEEKIVSSALACALIFYTM